MSEITPSTFAEGTTLATQTTISATRTLTAGTYLKVTASYDLSNGTPTCTIGSTGASPGTFGAAQDAANDATAGQGGVQFLTSTPAAGGSCTITVTFSIAVFSATIHIQEFRDVFPPGAAHGSQLQAAPGTTADAITSGNITPAGGGGPAVFGGLTMDLGGASTATPAVGTGETDSGSGWGLGVGHNLARAASIRTTTGAARGVTFTASSNDRYGTWAAAFVEAGSAAAWGSSEAPRTWKAPAQRPESVAPIGARIVFAAAAFVPLAVPPAQAPLPIRPPPESVAPIGARIVPAITSFGWFDGGAPPARGAVNRLLFVDSPNSDQEQIGLSTWVDFASDTPRSSVKPARADEQPWVLTARSSTSPTSFVQWANEPPRARAVAPRPESASPLASLSFGELPWDSAAPRGSAFRPAIVDPTHLGAPFTFAPSEFTEWSRESARGPAPRVPFAESATPPGGMLFGQLEQWFVDATRGQVPPPRVAPEPSHLGTPFTFAPTSFVQWANDLARPPRAPARADVAFVAGPLLSPFPHVSDSFPSVARRQVTPDAGVFAPFTPPPGEFQTWSIAPPARAPWSPPYSESIEPPGARIIAPPPGQFYEWSEEPARGRNVSSRRADNPPHLGTPFTFAPSGFEQWSQESARGQVPLPRRAPEPTHLGAFIAPPVLSTIGWSFEPVRASATFFRAPSDQGPVGAALATSAFLQWSIETRPVAPVRPQPETVEPPGGMLFGQLEQWFSPPATSGRTVAKPAPEQAHVFGALSPALSLLSQWVFDQVSSAQRFDRVVEQWELQPIKFNLTAYVEWSEEPVVGEPSTPRAEIPFSLAPLPPFVPGPLPYDSPSSASTFRVGDRNYLVPTPILPHLPFAPVVSPFVAAAPPARTAVAVRESFVAVLDRFGSVSKQIVGSFEKHPAAETFYTLDLTAWPWLPGERIATFEWSVWPNDGFIKPGTSGLDPTGKKATIWVRGGRLDRDYVFSLAFTTTLSPEPRKDVKEMVIRIRDARRDVIA